MVFHLLVPSHEYNHHPTNFVNMKNVSRSSSSSNKMSSCFRPEVDFDPPSPSSFRRSSSFRMACLPLPPTKHHHSSVHHHPSPKPTFSLLIKALTFHTRLNKKARLPSRQGSKRRSSGGERTMMNQATKAFNASETKAESPPSCWSSSSESGSSSKSDEGEIRSEDKSEKKKKSEWLGIFMVVFSLTLTVMVGKYWGALLTSTWLYFFSLAKAGKEKAKMSGRQVHVKKNRSVVEGRMVGS